MTGLLSTNPLRFNPPYSSIGSRPDFLADERPFVLIPPFPETGTVWGPGAGPAPEWGPERGAGTKRRRNELASDD